MRIRVVAAAAVVAGMAGAASGQVITTPGITARLDLTWQEDPVYPHNDNGVLEPGERALMLMSVSFTGQGTRVNWTPNWSPWQDGGIIIGFGYAYVSITGSAGDATGFYNSGITNPTSTSVGPNADAAGAMGYGVRGGWRLGGNIANGQPVLSGMMNIGPGQLPVDPPHANQTNPIANVERLGWQPGSYPARTQTFTVAGAAGTNNNVVGLYLDLDSGTTGMNACVPTANITFGSVSIPIVPAPAGLALFGLCGLFAVPRRARARACLERRT